MNPFIIKEKVEASFFESIFKTEPKFNAIIEINNLLASKPLKTISSNDIAEIASKYKLDIKRTYRDHFQNFYSVYLNYCFNDRKLTETELDGLQHLKRIFFLSEKETSEINRKVSERVYAEETKKALTDGRLTEDEKKFLNELKGNLAISENTAKKIYTEVAQDYFKIFFNEIISDNRISLEEERELTEIANSLGLEVNMDDRAKSTFDKMKLLWLVENDKIPVIDVNIPLLKGEACCFKTSCRLMEKQKSKPAYNSMAQKDKKLREDYPSGEAVLMMPEDSLDTLDKGHIYLTNKRLIFIGAKVGKSIPFNKIDDFIPFINGVEIQEKGENMCFLNFYEHIDVFTAMLSRSVFK